MTRVVLTLVILNLMANSFAQDVVDLEDEENADSRDEIPVRIYRSPEERREAGLGTELTDWLSFSGLIEVEKERSKDRYQVADENQHFTVVEDDVSDKNVQLGFTVEAFGWLEMEVIYEVEKQKKTHGEFDEVLIGVDLDGLGVKIGRQSLPFGEYFSHFTIGPMLEFGEIRQDSIIVDWSPSDHLELSAFAFEGRVNPLGENDKINWGASLEWLSRDESIRFGLGYLSDISEADDPLLDRDVIVIDQEIPAWNAYLLWGISDRVETTVEFVSSLKNFREFDGPVNRPQACNWEIAYIITSALQVSARYERGNEIEDEVENKYGVSLSWRPAQRVGVTFDYLYGRYRRITVFDDDDNEARRNTEVAAQIAFEF